MNPFMNVAVATTRTSVKPMYRTVWHGMECDALFDFGQAKAHTCTIQCDNIVTTLEIYKFIGWLIPLFVDSTTHSTHSTFEHAAFGIHVGKHGNKIVKFCWMRNSAWASSFACHKPIFTVCAYNCTRTFWCKLKQW